MVAEIMKGLNQFFSQFGTAYIETSIPESVSFPYITYKCGSEDWKNKALISCSIYSKSSSYKEVSEIAEKILDSARDGVIIDIEVEYQYDETNPDADNQLEAALEEIRKKLDQ